LFSQVKFFIQASQLSKENFSSQGYVILTINVNRRFGVKFFCHGVLKVFFAMATASDLFFPLDTLLAVMR
jgi:hypothetical protein